MTLDGTTGYFSTINQLVAPQIFTQLAWFNATASGSILSFEDQANTTVASYDRMVWIDPTGHVVAGVYPGSIKELVSPATYDNGSWYLVAVTLSSAGFYLHVDGSLVASSTTITSAQVYSGYWHLGWSNPLSSWTDGPSTRFLPGSLAGVAVLPTALSGAAISSLYASARFGAYSASVLGDTPSAYWALQTPVAAAGAGCSEVEITATLNGTCLYPASCTAPSTSGTLAGLVTESSTITLAPATPVTLALVYEEAAGLPSALSLTHVISSLDVVGQTGNAQWTVELQHAGLTTL